MTDTKKIRLFVFFAILLCSHIRSFPQSEKEIVSKYRSALCKTVDDASIQTIELKGIFTTQKLNFPAAIYYRAPGLRVEMTIQNLTFIQISNDSIKWDYNPINEKHTITPVTKKNNGWADGNSSFDFINNDLLNYEELGHRLKLKGKEKVDSLDVYILELSRKDKTKSKFLISSKSNLIYKVEDDKGYRYFARYSNNGGYIFPKYVFEYNPSQQLEVHFNELSFNKSLADSLFIIPDHAYRKKSDPEAPKQGLIATADELYYDGKYEDAITHYTKAINENDQNEYAYNARGLAKIGLKDYYEAIMDFSKALEINPGASQSRNNIGLAKYYLGDHAGAVKDYTKALELDPALVVAYKNRGLIYQETEKYDQAVQDFTRALELSPEDGITHFRLGVTFAELDRYEDALKSYARAMKNRYNGADIYNYKGVSEFRLEKYDSATASFKRALTFEPEHLQYVENYARALYEQGDFKGASEQFERYLQKRDDNASIHNMNGLCKYHEENYKGAIKDFSKSIELNGKEATYYDNRAAAKEMIEDYEGAIKDYSESIRVYPNDAAVFYKRGMIKIITSKKLEGCLDLATANEMKYEPAKDAIMRNCH